MGASSQHLRSSPGGWSIILSLLALRTVAAAAASSVLSPPSPPWFTPSASLPEVMRFNNGSAVTTLRQWRARRLELRELLEEWIVGAPPAWEKAPALLSVARINASTSNVALSQYLSLSFRALHESGGGHTDVSFTVWVSCPAEQQPRKHQQQSGSRSVMLTQWNHRLWAQRAVGRGLCAVVYPGADDNDASALFADAYDRPPAVWGKIARRAWLASRVIDALPSMGLPVGGASTSHSTSPIPSTSTSTTGEIFITGHSRNGKQSVLAAAFDERISAVVGSSPGAPIASPWRFSSREFQGEGPEFCSAARGWWLPRCAAYQGKENELPADGHFALALLAGRRLMLGTARHDFEGDISFANEQALAAVAPAFALAGGSACVQYREGRHHGFIDLVRILHELSCFHYLNPLDHTNALPPPHI